MEPTLDKPYSCRGATAKWRRAQFNKQAHACKPAYNSALYSFTYSVLFTKTNNRHVSLQPCWFLLYVVQSLHVEGIFSSIGKKNPPSLPLPNGEEPDSIIRAFRHQALLLASMFSSFSVLEINMSLLSLYIIRNNQILSVHSSGQLDLIR